MKFVDRKLLSRERRISVRIFLFMSLERAATRVRIENTRKAYVRESAARMESQEEVRRPHIQGTLERVEPREPRLAVPGEEARPIHEPLLAIEAEGGDPPRLGGPPCEVTRAGADVDDPLHPAPQPAEGLHQPLDLHALPGGDVEQPRVMDRPGRPHPG